MPKKVTSKHVAGLVRLLVEELNRIRWIRADTFPGPYVRPKRSLDEWIEEADKLLYEIDATDT